MRELSYEQTIAKYKEIEGKAWIEWAESVKFLHGKEFDDYGAGLVK